MRCIFCKSDVDVRPIRPLVSTPNMEGICVDCLKGLKTWLKKVKD